MLPIIRGPFGHLPDNELEPENGEKRPIRFSDQSAQGMAAVPAIVIQLELEALRQMVKTEKLLGNIVVRVEVIAIEKRGLSHAHLMIS